MSTYTSHIDAARKAARSYEFGMGPKTQFLRSISRQVGRVIRPGTIAAEEAIMAFHDEKQKMSDEKQTLYRLEYAFKGASA